MVKLKPGMQSCEEPLGTWMRYNELLISYASYNVHDARNTEQKESAGNNSQIKVRYLRDIFGQERCELFTYLIQSRSNLLKF